MQSTTAEEAGSLGSNPFIRTHAPMHAYSRLSGFLAGAAQQVLEIPIEGNGFLYQAAEGIQYMRQCRAQNSLKALE